MICTQCGIGLKSDHKFCYGCGARAHADGVRAASVTTEAVFAHDSPKGKSDSEDISERIQGILIGLGISFAVAVGWKLFFYSGPDVAATSATSIKPTSETSKTPALDEYLANAKIEEEKAAERRAANGIYTKTTIKCYKDTTSDTANVEYRLNNSGEYKNIDAPAEEITEVEVPCD